ncbi:Rho GTPase activating protein [Entamoeba marina]
MYNKKFETKEVSIVTYSDEHLYLIENSNKPKFQIDLSMAIFDKHVEKNKYIQEGKEKLCFELIYDKVYVFMCPSESDYDEWIATLPLITKVYGTFGYPLASAVSKSSWRFPIPIFRALEYLEKHNSKQEEGIFRTSASYKITGRVKQILDGDQDINIENFEESACAAAIIKDYLRDLPDPLIPYKHYNEFVVLARMKEETRVEEAKTLVNKLPEINQDTLWYLCKFCKDVLDNVELSQMNATNLGTCLAPTVCRTPPQERMKEMENTKLIIESFATLVSEFQRIFDEITVRNMNAGMVPPSYPCVIPHPKVPYDQVTAEIKKAAEERSKRISSGKTRQTMRFKRSSVAEPKNALDILKKKISDAHKTGPSTTQTHHTSEHTQEQHEPLKQRPSLSAPRPPSPRHSFRKVGQHPSHQVTQSDSTTLPPIQHNPQQSPNVIPQKPTQAPPSKPVPPKLTQAPSLPAPSLPPPRRKTNSIKDETERLETKVKEQDDLINDLEKKVEFLLNKLQEQEDYIQSLLSQQQYQVEGENYQYQQEGDENYQYQQEGDENYQQEGVDYYQQEGDDYHYQQEGDNQQYQ